MSGGGRRGWWNQLSTFDAEFKFAKIQNFHFQGGGWWCRGGIKNKVLGLWLDMVY